MKTNFIAMKIRLFLSLSIFTFFLVALASCGARRPAAPKTPASATVQKKNDLQAPARIESFSENPNEPQDAVPEFLVDEFPVYPGCEGKPGTELRNCFYEKISDHINRHFDPYAVFNTDTVTARRIQLKGTFTVDKEGRVTYVRVRSPYPDLNREFERVLYALPPLQPARSGGKPVNVTFHIPVMFKVEKKTEKDSVLSPAQK
ncbi:MAG: hypothetical protein GXO27_05240 [Chlorobi bacterium]|nr:hypothetical protein [Chlorobiota bacterium]